MKVFVYGTLKKGKHNHWYLEDSDYLGRGKTKEKYNYSKSGGLPKVTKESGDGDLRIRGELYEINKDVLRCIDELESHPNLYKREKVDIIINGSIKKAWCYFYNH